ncbi:MAG: F0F1 ATP synthase subunit A [Eubacteriales bacterium]|nr:F0F1 ATP synthase subunit A [Eubacteriales bacterium]
MSYIGEFFRAFGENLIEEVKFSDMGEEISHAILPKSIASFDLAGFNVVLSDATIATWGVMILITILAIVLGYRPQRIPSSKRQQIAEIFVNTLMKLAQSTNMTYEQSEKIVPYVGTIAVFISLTNLVVLFKISPPAKNIAFPIALALFTLVYVIVMSIRFVGLKGFLKSLIYPQAALLPFKILDYLIKPVSLSLRLFGNIFGAYILMEFIYLVIPIVLPGVVGLWFDIADGILQGVIFTYLSITYIGEVIEGAHMYDHDRKLKEANAH